MIIELQWQELACGGARGRARCVIARPHKLRAQLSLEAMIVIAAFIAFLALLISAASENAEQTASAGAAIAHEKAGAYRLLASSVVEDDGVVFSDEEGDVEGVDIE